MICRTCKTKKPVASFYSAPRNTSGYQYDCKTCYDIRQSKYCELNKLKIKQYHQDWYKRNRTRILGQCKKYRQSDQGKECRRIWERRKMQDLTFKLEKALRTRLRSVLKNNYKAGSAIRDLGCSVASLRLYLGMQFYGRLDGTEMTWDNYGIHGWHIDHIEPLSSFDLEDRGDFLAAVHFTNLQPLWAEDNYAKRDRRM